MLYAVIYELNNKGKNYERLYKKLQDSDAWMHYIENLWIILSTEDAESIFEGLRPFIDEVSDYMVVYQLGDDRQGWLPPKAWKWINDAEG